MVALVWFLARATLAFLVCLFLHRAARASGLFAGRDRRLHGVRRHASAGELEVEAGPGTPSRGDRFVLGTVTVLGRSPESDIVILDPYVSARHAEIALEGPRFVVRDLGSANGTYVNGKRLGRGRFLRRGDRLELGDTVFRFRR